MQATFRMLEDFKDAIQRKEFEREMRHKVVGVVGAVTPFVTLIQPPLSSSLVAHSQSASAMTCRFE